MNDLELKLSKLSPQELNYLSEELNYIIRNNIDISKINIQKHNPNNILLWWILGLSDYPKELKHKYIYDDYPDIDVDFSSEGRQKIKEYLMQNYACMEVAIYQYTTLKSALYYAAKALGIDTSDIYRITKNIEYDPTEPEHNTLEYIVSTNADVDNFIRSNNMQDYVELLANNIKSISKHGSAHIITTSTDNIPTVSVNKNIYCALTESHRAKLLSKLGYVKFDFLGLIHLDVLQYMHNIHKVDFNNVNHDDPKIYKIVNELKLLGIFQLNTKISTYVVSYIKPDSFNDLVNINAICRPNALRSNVHIHYVKRKNNDDYSGYPDYREIKHHLSDRTLRMMERTYGLFIFQEQIQSFVADICDVNFDAVNPLRKLISVPPSKRTLDQVKIIEEYRNKFLQRLNEDWWNIIGELSYAFNMAHATAYTEIAFRELYYKTYHPYEFYYAINKYLEVPLGEIKDEFDIDIVLPSKNNIRQDTEVIDNKIYIGLSSIKHLRSDQIKNILAGKPSPAANKILNAIGFYNTNKTFDTFYHQYILLGYADIPEQIIRANNDYTKIICVLDSYSKYSVKGNKYNMIKATDFRKSYTFRTFCDIKPNNVYIINVNDEWIKSAQWVCEIKSDIIKKSTKKRSKSDSDIDEENEEQLSMTL